MSEVISEIKEMRLQLDGLAQLISDLKPLRVWGHETIGNPDADYKCAHTEYETNSDPIKGAVNDLFFAKGWLGQLLGFLKVPTPYQNDGKRKGVEDIEPADDHIEGFEDEAGYSDKNYVEKVDYLRQVIQSHKEQVLSWSVQPGTHVPNRHALWCVEQIWVRLTNARMYLGFEMQRIYDEHRVDVIPTGQTGE